MSLVDKVIATLTPPESLDDRTKATAEARAAAAPGDWLSMALDHHDAIRAAFEACLSASRPDDRLNGIRRLAIVLNGHSLAEELVLYPALADAGDKLHS